MGGRGSTSSTANMRVRPTGYSDKKQTSAGIRKAIAAGEFVALEQVIDSRAKRRNFTTEYVQIGEIKYPISPRTFNLMEQEFGFKADRSGVDMNERFRHVRYYRD